MRTRARLVPVLSSTFGVLLIAACGAEPEPPALAPKPSVPATPGEAAVWTLPEGTSLSASSTAFTALVSRLGCNSGVTGEVLAPGIRVGETEIVVTFTVAPKPPGAAACPSNDQVRFEVGLPEPLRGRQLVDGQCLAGAEAAATSFCHPGPVRYKPQ
ncbi:hypothetical protein [Actinoplanes sp. NPDC026670]|uniref:hypothetical protein n=1 Tax=Actinoplanes sp. NPDC026670 TaxID=3154700 RepID=UPI0033E67442